MNIMKMMKQAQELQAKAAAIPERKTYGLTPRELEVVTCIVEGCSNRDIAGHRCKHARANKVGRRQAVVKTRCDMSPS